MSTAAQSDSGHSATLQPDRVERYPERAERAQQIEDRKYSPRYTPLMDTTIKVDSKTRDRLAVLAEAHGTSMRALIEEFAESTLTPAERKERADHTAAYLAEHFGVTVTDESSAEVLRGVRGQVVAHHAAEQDAA